MIQFKKNIESISEFQNGILPKNARKLETPQSTEDMMKKAMPICVILCALVFITMFLKTFTAGKMVINPLMALVGFGAGYLLLIVHEWLHAIVYPKEATVTIGKIKGKLVFVALASYPLKRGRFILMCLLPFVLGIVPYAWFVISEAENINLNGLLFGLTCMGMVSPYPDAYNIFFVLKHTTRADRIMFYEEDIYCISNELQLD